MTVTGMIKSIFHNFKHAIHCEVGTLASYNSPFNNPAHCNNVMLLFNTYSTWSKVMHTQLLEPCTGLNVSAAGRVEFCSAAASRRR